jgi:glycosyltransferase involved in cell wall biosynthesis
MTLANRHPAPAEPSGPDPLVSVIIPVYNRAGHIATTLETVFRQTYARLEVIVVDDGSTDGSSEVLDDLTPQITVVHQENLGAASARNAGFARSSGSIIMFLDSDDAWLPDAVEARVRVLQRAGPAVPCVMCDLRMQRADGTVETMFASRKLRPPHEVGLWTNPADVLSTRFLFTNQTLAIRREAFERLGGYDEGLWVMEDFEFAMRLASTTPWAYTTAVLATWHEGSSESLTAAAGLDPVRLNRTIAGLCRRLGERGVAASGISRLGIAHMIRRAERNERLASANGWRALTLRSQRFLEEEVAERLVRHSPAYPAIRSIPL